MKKKIIFVAFCLILFLIFTTLSYGLDPRQIRLRGDPWDHMLSPGVPKDTTSQLEASIFLISFNFNASIVICASKDLSLNRDIDHSSSIQHKKRWTNSSKATLKR